MIDQPPVGSDDALSQPTRARLFALLGELARPAGTLELAEHVGLHSNGIRLHLERLERDGLVLRGRHPQERGRPQDTWRIAPDARPGGHAPSAYGDLVRWLARAIGTGTGGLEGIEATGREIGRELASRQGWTGEEAFASMLTSLGFQPHTAVSGTGQVSIHMRNCPYRDAVRENQPVICALHKAITQGLIEVMQPHSALSDFTPRDPYDADCLIELRHR